MTLEKKEANNFDSYSVESLVKRFINEATILSDAGKELSFRLPFSATPHFTKLFTEIDDNLEKLNLRSYGMSVTTLEEVILFFYTYSFFLSNMHAYIHTLSFSHVFLSFSLYLYLFPPTLLPLFISFFTWYNNHRYFFGSLR